jgi:hypothetical protein
LLLAGRLAGGLLKGPDRCKELSPVAHGQAEILEIVPGEMAHGSEIDLLALEGLGVLCQTQLGQPVTDGL